MTHSNKTPGNRRRKLSKRQVNKEFSQIVSGLDDLDTSWLNSQHAGVGNMAGSGPRDYSLAEDDSRWRPPKVSRGKWKLWWGVLALQWLIIVAICASYVATGSEMSAPLAAAVTALICLTPVTISLAVKSSRH